MTNTSSIHTGQIWGGELPLVPDGKYDLGFLDYFTALKYGRSPKLVVRFKIIEMGDYFDVELSKYYNVNRLIGKPGRHGDFQVGRMSKFLREYVTLFPDQPIERIDRIPMSRFQNVIVRGSVRTVFHGSDQRKIPKPLQYSVVGDLIKVKRL